MQEIRQSTKSIPGLIAADFNSVHMANKAAKEILAFYNAMLLQKEKMVNYNPEFTEETKIRLSGVNLEALKAFYTVDSLELLAKIQALHIENLQKQLSVKDSYTRNFGAKYI